MQYAVRFIHALRDNVLVACVLLLALALVLLWAAQSRTMEQQRDQLLAQREARELVLKLQERMRAYEQVLRGAKALLEANPDVNRAQWQTYVRSTLLRAQFPGILGIGFAVRISPGELTAHERRIRAEGFPDYRVHPAGDGDPYSAIIFMEPFEGRNKRAFGYDMWDEPVRREAMRLAGRSGASVLSGRVTLLQDDGAQAGLLQYVPVYRGPGVADSPAQREHALLGWVYIPYFADDLIRGVIGNTDYRVKIYDGETEGAPIYDSIASAPEAEDAIRVKEPLTIGQRVWTVALSSAGGASHASSAPMIILTLGTLASLLLAWMVATAGRMRRRAEAGAARDRELLNAVLTASPSPVWVKDESKRWIMVNPAAETVLGARAEHVIGKTARELYPPDIATQIDAQDDATFASRAIVTTEGQMFVLDGEPRWGIKRKRAVALPDGRRILVAAVEDLTECRAVQTELERSRAFLVRILDAAPQPIFVKDTAHKWLIVNEAFCRLYGRRREELIGRTDADYRDAAWVRRSFEQDDRALACDEALQWEDHVAGISGSPGQWILRTKRSVSLPDGSRYVVGVNTDITSLKLAERSLQETRERLSVLNRIAGAMAQLAGLDEVLDTAVHALARAFPLHRISFSSIAPDGTTQVLYSRCCGPMPSLAGSSLKLQRSPALLETLRMRALLEIVDIRNEPLYAPLLPALGEDPVRAALEAPLRIDDELVGVLYMDAADIRTWSEHERRTLTEAAGYLGIALERDRARLRQVQAERERSAAYAALKESEEELRRHRDDLQGLVGERTRELSQAKEAAERANRAKSEFLTRMSHELRTPMHAVLSFARLGIDKIVAQRFDTAKLRQYFERIDQSGERLLHLLNDLLDVPKLESGYMRYDFADHELTELARGVLQELDTLARRARVHLSLAADAGGRPIRCDGMRLAQVIRNLVSNGIKFTPAGGSVTVRLEEVPTHEELGGCRALVLTVCDTGPGIPQGEADLIFDKFMQSSRTRNNAGGTGLGLTICREIIQAHGGFIRVTNGAEGGAVFIAALPLSGGPQRLVERNAMETTGESM